MQVNIGRAAMTGFLLACVLEFIGGGVAPLSLLHIIPVGSSTLSNGGPFLTLLVALFAVNGFGAFSLFGDYTGEDNDAF
jgi:hypothetical protein